MTNQPRGVIHSYPTSSGSASADCSGSNPPVANTVTDQGSVTAGDAHSASGSVVSAMEAVPGKVTKMIRVTLKRKLWDGKRHPYIGLAKSLCRNHKGVTVKDNDAKTKGFIIVCGKEGILKRYIRSLLKKDVRFDFESSDDLGAVKRSIGSTAKPLQEDGWKVNINFKRVRTKGPVHFIPCTVSLGVVAKFRSTFSENIKSAVANGGAAESRSGGAPRPKRGFEKGFIPCADLEDAMNTYRIAGRLAGEARKRFGDNISVIPCEDKELKSGFVITGDGHMSEDGSYRVAFTAPEECVSDFASWVAMTVQEEESKSRERFERDRMFDGIESFRVPDGVWTYPAIKKFSNKYSVEFKMCGKTTCEETGVSLTQFKLIGRDPRTREKAAREIKNTLESIETGDRYVATVRLFESFPGCSGFDALDEMRSWMLDTKEIPTKNGGVKSVPTHHALKADKKVYEELKQKVYIKANGEMRPCLRNSRPQDDEEIRVAYVLNSQAGSYKSYADRVHATQRQLFKEKMPFGEEISRSFPANCWEKEYAKMVIAEAPRMGRERAERAARQSVLDAEKAKRDAKRSKAVAAHKMAVENAQRDRMEECRKTSTSYAGHIKMGPKTTYDEVLTVSKKTSKVEPRATEVAADADEVTPMPEDAEDESDLAAIAQNPFATLADEDSVSAKTAVVKPVETISPGKKGKKKRNRGVPANITIGCAPHKSGRN